MDEIAATIVLIWATLCHISATLYANLGYFLYEVGLPLATKDYTHRRVLFDSKYFLSATVRETIPEKQVLRL